MARYRSDELQLLIGTLPETTVGEARGDQVYTRLTCQFKRIPRSLMQQEHPGAKQEFGHEDHIFGNSDGKFGFDVFLYSKLGGVFPKCAHLLKWLVGKQHADDHWLHTVTAEPVSQTAASVTIATGTILPGDVGACAVVDVAGRLYPVIIIGVAVGSPNDTVTFLPEVPGTPLSIRAIPTYYFDSDNGVKVNTYPVRQIDPAGEQLDQLGGSLQGKFVIRPVGKEPYVKFSGEVCFTNQETDDGGSYTLEDEDNAGGSATPISTILGCDMVLGEYNAGARVDDRTVSNTLDFGEFEFDAGWSLEGIPNGRRRSSLGGWQEVLKDGTMKGSFTVPYSASLHTDNLANTPKHLIFMAGSNLVNGIFILYFPRIILGKPEDISVAGEKWMKVPFVAKVPRDISDEDNPVEYSPFVIGFAI